MPSQLTQGIQVGAGLARLPSEIESKQQEILSKRSEQANKAISDVLGVAAELGKAFQSGGSNMTPEQYQEQINNIVNVALRTSQLGTQAGLSVMTPELLEAQRKNLLAVPTAMQAAETKGVLEGTGKVSSAKAISSQTGIPEQEVYQSQGLALKPEKPLVQINQNAENAFAKQVGKVAAEKLFERRQSALDAANSLQGIAEQRRLLNEGIVSGAFADFQVGLGNVLLKLGVNFDADPVKNAQAYGSATAKQTAQIIKAFGAGTGLSDADREYALKAAGGDISMNETAIRRILDINERASVNIIKSYNKEANNVPKEMAPYPLTVDLPQIKQEKKVIRTGTYKGRKVNLYSDGSTEYAD